MQVDLHGAVRIACLAAEFDWTWTIDDIARFCATANWTEESRDEHGVNALTGLNIEDPGALFVYDLASLSRYGKPGQQVSELTLPVSDQCVTHGESCYAPTLDPTLRQNHRSLTDTFAALTNRITAELGEPAHSGPGPEPSIRWHPMRKTEGRSEGTPDESPEAVIELCVRNGCLDLRIINPAVQAWWDAWVADTEEDEEIAEDEDGTWEAYHFEDFHQATDVMPDKPRTWPEFSAALALTLTRLRQVGVLVLNKGDQCSAEFRLTPFRISCRLARAQSFPPGDSVAMTDNGWSFEQDTATETWVLSTQWPAPYQDLETLADAAVRAVRELIHVADPADLEVSGWDDYPSTHPDLTAFGICSYCDC
ncbi:DUF6301 family protein [Nocardia tengchongensis]|uniref:DUF6301 family protein n=1 Tax=Nocardia tengchongensis TaxID=2055889 RepID=UPI0033DE7D8B